MTYLVKVQGEFSTQRLKELLASGWTQETKSMVSRVST